VPSDYTIENRFIITCLGTVLPGILNDDFTFPEDTLNWDYIVTTSELNGVIPLVSKSLNLYGKDIVPADVIETFYELNRESAVSNLIKVKELLYIYKKFKESGITSVVLKGAGLGSEAYGDISLRPFGDLDILVRKEKLAEAIKILIECGYEHIFDYTEKQAELYKQSVFYLKDQDMHYSFYNPLKKIHFELHWALMPPKYSFSQDVDEVFENAVAVSEGQGEFYVPGLEDLIIYLSLHGTKHYWSRLIWIFDVAILVEKKKDIRWEVVIAKSEEFNCLRSLLLSLYLAEKMYSAGLPKIIKNYIDKDNRVAELAKQVEKNYTAIYDLENIESKNKLFFLKSMESNKDKLLFLAGIVFKPTIYELEVVALPHKLSFLYYLVRPLRLVKKYFLKLFSYN